MTHSQKITPAGHAWCMYDWAISAFQTTIVGAILPVFFRQVACINWPEHQMATSLWGIISAISMTGVAALSLILGPAADYRADKKKFLGLFTLVGILFTIAIAMTGPGQWIWLAVVFIIAGIGAAGSEVFYDALLPHVASPDMLNQISTRGYALGYLGGGILLVINIVMMNMLPLTEIAPGISVPLTGMQLSFLSVAIWWGVFSIPLFRRVQEPAIHLSGQQRNVFMISFGRLHNTFRDIRKYRNPFMFLIAFWFYNDGIGTVIKMATAYGDEIGIGLNDLIGAFILVQFIGIPCTLLYGKLAVRIGAKRAIFLGLIVYLIISIGGFFMKTAIHFWILAGVVGLVQGGTQALSRSLYASMIPKEKSTEFFSFFTISGKFAGIAGPVLFALASQLFHNSRYGILSLIFFFILGGILLLKVRIPGENGDPATAAPASV